ncbi:MAG TPA: sugar isomerase domain-containing protein [Bryobacteraceae bacterium]|nr:sugar isomerase domain-containing protein [Bryobacteraceae bacterium]
MSANQYYESISGILAKIHSTQAAHLEKAAEAMAGAIAARKRVYLFGSGHSVIPVMDVFPRYGSFIGFFPLYDPRLMWSNVVGPGGARELLWLERKEGYIEVFLQSYPMESGDVMVVFSHGGLNAAPIEAAQYARKRGLTVITVSSLANAKAAKATHSSGEKLPDVADIAIDNCVSPEDSQVDIGRPERVAAGSTMAAVFVAMSLVAETGARLVAKGHVPVTFVSPNVPGIEKDHNQEVFRAYSRELFSRGDE